MWRLQVMQGVLKIALQWYAECYCLASVTKTFTRAQTRQSKLNPKNANMPKTASHRNGREN
jgi:hypothetical protein